MEKYRCIFPLKPNPYLFLQVNIYIYKYIYKSIYNHDGIYCRGFIIDAWQTVVIL